MNDPPLLDVRDLHVRFPAGRGAVSAVRGLSFSLGTGSTLAIVGESGSGKTVTGSSLLRLLPGAMVSGRILLDGTDVVTAPADDVRRLRGRTAAMVFQDPMSSLHPFYRVGFQLEEALPGDLPRRERRERMERMLARVGVARPAEMVRAFPHELSGGMRQRVMIAMALLNSPRLLVADEPTTALDVTVQAQVLDLLRELQRETGLAILLITHDLGVVAEIADDVLVMYAGLAVERAPVAELFSDPQMPYTIGLLASIPRLGADPALPLRPISGQPPSLPDPPSGCPFHPRCPYTAEVDGDRCRTEEPVLAAVALRDRPDGGAGVAGGAAPAGRHAVRCHIPPERRRELAAERLAPLREARPRT